MKSLTESAEEYLEAIYRLEEDRKEIVKVSSLARFLKLTPSTVTEMLQRLSKRGFVQYIPFQGVRLSEKGSKIANRIIRRHRLVERLLTDMLKIEPTKVHREACRLEHAISPYLEEKLEEILDNPKTCPHGNPIPTKAGKSPKHSKSLVGIKPPARVLIARIVNENEEFLSFLDDIGIRVNSKIRVLGKNPSTRSLTVAIDGVKHVLSYDFASFIRIKPIPEN
ncbi:MAG: metal-dependent transcriptional regulator [Candidatus Hodarchaeota archaeon]